jgi:hypothetical protein
MASAAEMLRRLESVSKITTLREMVYVHIKANEDILRDLKEEEYEQGNIYSNKTTRRYKWDWYGNEKYQQNPRANGNVDLILTGAFINSFKLNKPNQNKYIFGATDPKRDKLVDMFGNIMSLEQQTFEDFQYVIIKPLFIADLKKIINKK